MEKGLIVISHGSRVPETDQIMSRYIEDIAQRLSFEHVEKAYLQFMNPNLEEAVNRLFALGIRQIIVFPFFLLNGSHTKENIPAQLNQLEQRFDGISFTYMDVIGYDTTLAQVICDRVEIYAGGSK